MRDDESRIDIKHEQITPVKDGYGYRSVLTVNKANVVDTGYYVCHHRGNEDINNQRVAAKAYIYIEGRLVVSYVYNKFEN